MICICFLYAKKRTTLIADRHSLDPNPTVVLLLTVSLKSIRGLHLRFHSGSRLSHQEQILKMQIWI